MWALAHPASLLPRSHTLLQLGLHRRHTDSTLPRAPQLPRPPGGGPTPRMASKAPRDLPSPPASSPGGPLCSLLQLLPLHAQLPQDVSCLLGLAACTHLCSVAPRHSNPCPKQGPPLHPAQSPRASAVSEQGTVRPQRLRG